MAISCTTTISWAYRTYPEFWRCYLNNGTQIYCNTSHYNCLTSFEADPDIASNGVGVHLLSKHFADFATQVIIGFVATAWYTIALCFVLAIYEARELYPSLSPARDYERKYPLEKMIEKIISGLCDLQTITGFAIAIAGLVQMPQITFYHGQFVVNFWQLTLISFWAAPNDYMRSRSFSIRAFIRRFAVLGSSTLYLLFAVMTLRRETSQWNSFETGRCYISNDTSGPSNSIFWIIGTSIYAAVLTLNLTPFILTATSVIDAILALNGQQLIQKVARIRSAFSGLYDTVRYDNLVKKVSTSYDTFLDSIGCALLLFDSSMLFRIIMQFAYLLRILKHLIASLFFLFVTTLVWLITNFFAIWSYGRGYYLLEIICYIGLGGWNTWYIIDLKIMNRDLMRGSESEWRFGQVLPTALLGFIIFITVDAFKEISHEIPR
ncbi:hypothetical protein CC78DRAFT_586964 [Lojkania enalia]|uniref:Uncharacterized protein n=1 Tax=Lojkania enalia TaxID=147567 RepID=A0A9P4JZK1_9PLEO|nr:hypothetical protein CC78DRAFT_586964 [Didymosphaeria enalia]